MRETIAMPRLNLPDRAARRACSLAEIAAAHQAAPRCDRPALEGEVSSRVWAMRYALKLRARRIAELEQQVEHLRLLQLDAVAAERSATSWLRRWAPELAAVLEASTGAWPR